MDTTILMEVINEITSNLSQTEKEKLAKLSERDFGASFHHGTGTAIRNNLGL